MLRSCKKIAKIKLILGKNILVVSADPVELYQKAQQVDRGESTALTPSLELLVDKAGKQLANDHKEALEKL
jgi:hypothetical protein